MADRVAQTVVKQVIEPILDPIFLADSYGYRPNKSALDAIGVTRQRCWKYDWVLEFDILIVPKSWFWKLKEPYSCCSVTLCR